MQASISPTMAIDGEQLLLQGPSRYLLTTPNGVGYNPVNGALTLTNQRLVFKPDRPINALQRVVLAAAGAGEISFPIRRVVACSEQPRKVQWGNPNVLRLEFDNGGREYFVVHPTAARPVGAWAAAVTEAKVTAPALEYGRQPALQSGFEQPANSGAKRLMKYWLISVVVLVLMCGVLAIIANALG